jgi:O-antigen ligase
MLLINLARIQEILPVLKHFRLGLLSILATLFISVLSGRFRFKSFFELKESKLIIGFWLVGFFSIFFSVWPAGAFKTWKTLMTTNTLIFICLLVNLESEEELSIATWTIIIASLVLCIGILLHPASETGQRLSTTVSYDANDVAMILVATYPFAIAKFLSDRLKIRIASGIILILMLLTLLKTGSRGGLLGLTVSGGIFLFSNRQISRTKKALTLVLVTIFIFNFAPETLWDRFADLYSGQDYNFNTGNKVGDDSYGRLELWRYSATLISENPLFGVGPGLSSVAMGSSHGRFFFMTVHNSYLQSALELGLFGLFIFLGLLASVWRNSHSACLTHLQSDQNGNLCGHAPFLRLGLVGYMVCAFFISQAYSVLIPILLAYSKGLASLSKKS